MNNYKSFSDQELLEKVNNLTHLARGLEDLLHDPAIGPTLGLQPWEQEAIKRELLETRPVIRELQHRGYGTEIKL